VTAKAPPKRRGRILFSLLLLLFGVGVVPLLGTSWYLVSRARADLELDQKKAQLDKVRSLSQQIALYGHGLEAQTQAIARTLEVDTKPGGFVSRIAWILQTRALERYVEKESALLSVSVVDTQGAGARSGFSFQEPSILRLFSEGLARGRQGDRMVSHPVISTALQEPILVMSEPVTPLGAPAPEGVVMVVASLAQLWAMAQQMGDEGLIDVYVVDVRGHLVAHSDPRRLSGDLDVSDVEIVRLFLESGARAGGTVPFQLVDQDGVHQMLGTYTRVPDQSGWGVIAQVDEAKAYHSVSEMRRQSAFVVGLVAVAAVVLGTFFSGQISHPIRQLARGARQLAAGEYGTRVAIRSANEVGILADAFNLMGAEIQKAIEQIREAARTNKELFMGSVRMLANAIDEKDPYTRGHSERVAYYAMIIAKHMGMPPEEVERVHLSGIIHDVGKIGIEDRILRKPSALTDEEYEIMKQHPTKGLHILGAVPRLKELAGAGLKHHENVDGTGYPEGLKGDEIPLLGRIVCVADAFDAMTTDRPYSKAMTFEAAVARLRFLAGKKFDPECVTGMEMAWEKGDLTPAKARQASIAAREQIAALAV
jgi:HD-GYP domain-containing protein (c-di-GMP phosphodiesterase class II)